MTITTKNTYRSHCPINFGLDSFGDKWSLLIVRDIAFFGKKTYGEFLKSEEGIATNVLASRLSALETIGIIQKSTHPDDRRKDIYNLTEKGLGLIPILFEIASWSEKYDADSEAKTQPEMIQQFRLNPKRLIKKAIEAVRKGQYIFSIITGQ